MDSVRFRKMVGWFDSARQDGMPAHDPGIEGLCLACELPLAEPMKTVSLMYAEQPRRCYFYRVHAACHCRENDQKALCAVDDLGMELEAKA
jgi:hypothetical protein